MKPRVILPGIDPDAGECVLEPADSHHLITVLRLKPGDFVEVVVPGTGVFDARVLDLNRGVARLALGGLVADPMDRESPLKIHVVMPFLKGDRTEWAVQKAVEAGASSFTLVVMDRCVVRPGAMDRRVDRLNRVVRYACAQSGRTALPSVEGVRNLREVRYTGEQVLVMDPGVEHGMATGSWSRIDLITGPEGGFSDEELAWFERQGWHRFALGPRVLRAETAVVAGTVALQVIAGDMG